MNRSQQPLDNLADAQYQLLYSSAKGVANKDLLELHRIFNDRLMATPGFVSKNLLATHLSLICLVLKITK